MCKEKLKTEKSFIAFIDLLGASELIENNSDTSLALLHDCYEEVKQYIAKWEKSSLAMPDIKIFSDNIIISIPLGDLENDKSFSSAMSIMVFAAYLQLYFWSNNLLVRGAITFGSYFEDEMMAWGKGLVKAYHLESNIAIYPRIIIDPEIEEIMCEMCKFFKTQLLSRDFDGIMFIDPYNIRGAENISVFIKDYLADNEKRIEDNKGNHKVLQKLNWLQNYFLEKDSMINKEF